MNTSNFLEFITKDIEAKKTLLDTLPLKTKTNKKKYNETVDEFEKIYKEYKDDVKNYLQAKARKIKYSSEKEIDERLDAEVKRLENLKFMINPVNTYVEKLGFDTLLYQISNYYRFNFNSLNEIINGFLDKFEEAGIYLTKEDFNYTCYVQEYMSSYLDVRRKKLSSYERVSEIFEQIYWVNPEIINHIELNFRRLIRKYEKKFNEYIDRLKSDAMLKAGITSYSTCLEKLQTTYSKINENEKESLGEIIDKARRGEFDINHYLEASKVRKQAYDSLIPENVNYNDAEEFDEICEALEKLQANIVEYMNYTEFKAMFDAFKKDFEDLLKENDKKNKDLINIIDQIESKEKHLDNLNKKIFTGKVGLFGKASPNEINKLKVDSVYQAKELAKLYEEYDKLYFKDKARNIISNTLSLADVLNFYYSFDFYKKITIQKVYDSSSYDEVVKYCEDFDKFIKNTNNLITSGVLLFEEINIPRIICNKYRLNNIKLQEEDLIPEGLSQLLNKILLILRVNTINKGNVSLEQIWFLTKVDKLINNEK